MALTKVTGKGLNSNVVDSTKLSTNSVTETKIASGAITSAKISDGTVSADDLTSSLDLSSKTITLPATSVTAAMLSNTLDLSSKTVTLPQSATATLDQNIALLGFKMAITDGLTVFNLVDGVVDEFEDESGVDNSASTNLNYCGTDDFYQNISAPVPYSAGFSMTTITEPDTSVSSTNPANGSGTFGTFTVPTNLTSIAVKVWGAGGGGGYNCGTFGAETTGGGGGGYAAGTLAVTPGQTIYVNAGEGGNGPSMPVGPAYKGFYNGPNPGGVGGGGLSGLFSVDISTQSVPQHSAPTAFIVAGSGGSGNYNGNGPQDDYSGGAGGGLTGCAGGPAGAEQTNARGPVNEIGGGGSQTVGGQGGSPAPAPTPNGGSGFLFRGGAASAGGGAGFYGGGAGFFSPGPGHGSGGGGSSYYSHPQVSSGSTEEGALDEGGGISIPGYTAGTNEGSPVGSNLIGEDGFVLITGTATGSTTSSTIISDPFTSTTVPTSARIVVFEENVGTPTLNTDIIASISRNNGSNYTTATLTDSGYVTGNSGQRILTGTATISGQPSGQSMRWKLELANNTVKIHGVALQWK